MPRPGACNECSIGAGEGALHHSIAVFLLLLRSCWAGRVLPRKPLPRTPVNRGKGLYKK
jgi:hypothetical protein